MLIISIILNIFFIGYFIVQQIKNYWLKQEKLESEKIAIGSTGIMYKDFYIDSISYSKCTVEFVIGGVSKTRIKIRVLDVITGSNIPEERRNKMISQSNGSWVDIDGIELCEINNRDYKINQIVE